MPSECLGACADKSIGLCYVDADHSYAGVQRDIAAALPKMRPGSLLVFNDYVLRAHTGSDVFGVVRAVNELVYCDIALQNRLSAALANVSPVRNG